MTFEPDDARVRIPRELALKLAKIAKAENITGRYAWGTLARKVLLEYIEHYEEEKNES